MWWYLLLREQGPKPYPRGSRQWVRAFFVAIVIIAALILIGRYA